MPKRRMLKGTVMFAYRNSVYLGILLVLVSALLLAALPAPDRAPTTPASAVFPARTVDAAKQPRLIAYLAEKYNRPLAQTERIVKASFREGRALGLPPELILGIIAKESSFRPLAESGYGAKGLMQVVPRLHQKLLAKHADGNPFSVDGNIKVGSLILKQYLKESGGDLKKALARYSGGARNYHAKVVDYWTEYNKVSQTDIVSVNTL